MDAKALAKSKRAHSLQHSKKSHPNQKSKNPSAATAIGDRKGREQPRRPALPSNWDRFGEEFGLEEEALGSDNVTSSSSTTSKDPDLVLPKSKGADFRYLIAEAQAQSQSHSSSHRFASLDDALPGDFNNGLASMLSVRGEGILSWIGDDNFVIEEETASAPEASFLSLNLHILAEQLEKVDLSERLFIDANLLPPELQSAGRSNQVFDQTESSESQATTKNAKELDLKDFSGKNEVINQNYGAPSLGSISNFNSDPLVGNQVSDTLHQGKRNWTSNPDITSIQGNAQESRSQTTISYGTGAGRPSFKAADAEAELDMLLDSFNETKLVDSSGTISGPIPLSQNVTSTPPPQLTTNAPASSKTASTSAVLDDVLDDLLDETSDFSNKQDLHQLPHSKPAPLDSQSSSTQSVMKSTVLDEFDSWLDTI